MAEAMDLAMDVEMMVDATQFGGSGLQLHPLGLGSEQRPRVDLGVLARRSRKRMDVLHDDLHVLALVQVDRFKGGRDVEPLARLSDVGGWRAYGRQSQAGSRKQRVGSRKQGFRV